MAQSKSKNVPIGKKGYLIRALAQSKKPAKGYLVRALAQSQNPGKGYLIRALAQFQKPAKGYLIRALAQFQKPEKGYLVRTLAQSQKSRWMADRHVIGFAPVLRFLRVLILCRFYEGLSGEAI